MIRLIYDTFMNAWDYIQRFIVGSPVNLQPTVNPWDAGKSAFNDGSDLLAVGQRKPYVDYARLATEIQGQQGTVNKEIRCDYCSKLNTDNKSGNCSACGAPLQ